MPDQCRLCGGAPLTPVLTLENAPRNIQRLPSKERLENDRGITLTVYRCAECDFVQLAERLEPDYYDDYLMTVSHSPQMRAFQRAQALEFVTRFGLAGKRVLEAGCGDGNYLQYLQEAGAEAWGIEPSQRFQEIARSRSLPVMQGYVGREHPVPGAPYDAFVTRQVLEHVPAPNDFLQGIRLALTPQGTGLVEVPSLEQALENGRFYDFFPDHLNYFSAHTLRHALERNGFDVVEMTRGMEGEYNVALVCAVARDDFAGLQRTLDLITRDLRDWVGSYHARGKRVAVWGAGGKGVTAVPVARLEHIAYVVDSDPNKQGRFMPVSHLPIFAPDRLLTDPVDALILTALAHRDEILGELRRVWRFGGAVAVLGTRLQILEGEANESH